MSGTGHGLADADPREERVDEQGTKPRISVVVPTYQRRELVVAAVEALAGQVFQQPFEVIVTVDGSTDGTADALVGLAVPFRLTVVEQPNAGASAARNVGAGRARGDILLFLDDDMIADPRLLEEHDRVHREGADAVLGHLPLHPASVPTAISAAVGEWSERRLARLSRAGAALTLHDLLTGQLSVAAEVFRAVGGFDLSFTRGGAFGNEDIDFGHRLLRAGYDVRFNPDAISAQKYVVTARQHLRQWRQAGRADVVFARKYPDEALSLFELNGLRDRFAVRVARPLSQAPMWALLSGPVRLLAAHLGDRPGRLPRYVLIRARSLEYWRGVSEAGGIPLRSARLRVLAYHSICDLAGRGALEPYGVPLEQFCRQLSALAARGFHAIGPAEFAAFLEGRAGLPRRSVLVTFDDGYDDLPPAVEHLRGLGAGALVFAVSSLLGLENEWDRVHGGQPLRLLDTTGLGRLRERGTEIGGHSRTHKELPMLAPRELDAEVEGCVHDLESLGLGPVRFFAYPYGEHDERVRKAVSDAGLRAAFTVRPGVMTTATDRLQIPRLEVLRADEGLRFVCKVLLARELSWLLPRYRRLHLAARWLSLGGQRRVRRALARWSFRTGQHAGTAAGSPPFAPPAHGRNESEG